MPFYKRKWPKCSVAACKVSYFLRKICANFACSIRLYTVPMLQMKRMEIDSRLVRGTPQAHEILPASRYYLLSWGGSLVRKLSQLSRLSPGISSCSVESVSRLCTPACCGLRVHDSRLRSNKPQSAGRLSIAKPAKLSFFKTPPSVQWDPCNQSSCHSCQRKTSVKIRGTKLLWLLHDSPQNPSASSSWHWSPIDTAWHRQSQQYKSI